VPYHTSFHYHTPPLSHVLPFPHLPYHTSHSRTPPVTHPPTPTHLPYHTSSHSHTPPLSHILPLHALPTFHSCNLPSPHSLPNGGDQISPPPVSFPLPLSLPSSPPHTLTPQPPTPQSLCPMRRHYHCNKVQRLRVHILSCNDRGKEERKQWLQLYPKERLPLPHCRVGDRAPRAYCNQEEQLLRVENPPYLEYQLVGYSLGLRPPCLKRAL